MPVVCPYHDLPINDSRRTGAERPQIGREFLLAALQINAPELGVTSGDHRTPIGDRGRGVNAISGRFFPKNFSILRVHAIHLGPIRSKNDP